MPSPVEIIEPIKAISGSIFEIFANNVDTDVHIKKPSQTLLASNHGTYSLNILVYFAL